MKDTNTKQKQKKFLEEYSKSLDIKASALAAGYRKQTALANVQNLLNNPATIIELKALCRKKASYLEICKGFILYGYLKILDWALDTDDNGKPNDTGAALRALDGIIKQTEPGNQPAETRSADAEENPLIVTQIKGLDPNKI